MTSPPREPILTCGEAAAWAALLADLQAELDKLGHRSVLARTRRLVLRASLAQYEPSGPTSPQLHILTSQGSRIVTTDGTAYYLTGGQVYPASDPAAAALHLSASVLPALAAAPPGVSA